MSHDWHIEHEMMQSYMGQANIAKNEAEAAMRKYGRFMDLAHQHQRLMELLLEIDTTPPQAA